MAHEIDLGQIKINLKSNLIYNLDNFIVCFVLSIPVVMAPLGNQHQMLPFHLQGWMYYNKEHLGDRPSRMEKAVQLLLKAIETDPNSGAAWYLIGRCAFSL